MQKLSDAKTGRYIIKWIFTEPELSRLLKEICIEVGREVTVLGNSRMGNILLRSDAGLFSMSTETVSGITV
ncbi:MAG: hypothetical protein Q4A65_05485 [Bacillota bacterium]|nr:hypothetical protein [Bacillota bacterium]